jgi:hypothetical protein
VHVSADRSTAWRHTIITVPSLLEVFACLRNVPPGGVASAPTIYVRTPWTPLADALILHGDDVPDGVATASGHRYLLEVDIALDVLEVWSAWRDGRTPTAEEATLAVIYYGEHDAYQPTA